MAGVTGPALPTGADADLRYWVAIRGSAVPSWPAPVALAEMRRATVRVGGRGEQTLWLIPGAGVEAIELSTVQSNYEALIGYRTRERQQEAVTTFLTGSIDRVRAEAERALREEVVLRPPPTRPSC
jgi:hypothetical protein